MWSSHTSYACGRSKYMHVVTLATTHSPCPPLQPPAGNQTSTPHPVSFIAVAISYSMMISTSRPQLQLPPHLRPALLTLAAAEAAAQVPEITGFPDTRTLQTLQRWPDRTIVPGDCPWFQSFCACHWKSCESRESRGNAAAAQSKQEIYFMSVCS